MISRILFILILQIMSTWQALAAVDSNQSTLRFLQVSAKTKEDRTAIANTGVSIETVRTDSVWVLAHPSQVERLKLSGHQILGNFDLSIARGGHQNGFDFPPGDSRFHNYSKTIQALKDIQTQNKDLTSIVSIGKSVEGKDLWAIHFNTSLDAHSSNKSNKPGIVFMGNHHAREHLSLEIPLMLAEYFAKNKSNSKVSTLLENRDIWIIPMVNPDGAEHDTSTGKYLWWRKNRRNNQDGTYGVDLNRNYGFKWGTGGSETDTSSDIYMGSAPFSEPETQAVRNFIQSHLNIKVLLSFHTFSELILYPWGHTYDSIGNSKDLATYEKMAKTMAGWNHYKPEQSSGLYIASGDTTDWAYGEHGIFAFTFELSPNSMWGGGFYPGAGVIDRVFQDNLQPCLYLTDLANDPYRVLDHHPTGWLKNYVEPRASESIFWQP